MENYSNYPKSFIDLVNEVNKKKNQSDVQYIGVGNPNAKILIIGKESAINTKEEEGKKQYKKEFLKNAESWLENIKNNRDLFDADKDEQWKKDINAPINPMYPYRGQRFVKYYKRKRKKNGVEIEVEVGCGGTSATWYNYQKIINSMKSISLDEARKRTICFHEYCFSTEFSSATADYSKNVDPTKRDVSIKTRRDGLLNDCFYQRFPIVIVAAGRYPEKFNINLDELFGVHLVGIIDKKQDSGLKRNWLKVYREADDKMSHKLLIHTNQLSIGITDKLIETIAEKCDDFIKMYNIKL